MGVGADWLVIAGRILLGAVFIRGGLHHFPALAPLTEVMKSRGVPFAREVLIGGSMFQIAAGAALMLGFYPAWAALGLVAFTLFASVMFMNFWDLQGEPRAAAVGGWFTNLALIGGLLIAAAQGWPRS